jgi:hypothetical protein
LILFQPSFPSKYPKKNTSSIGNNIHDHRLYLRESQKTPLSLEHPLHTAIFTNRRALPIYGHRNGDEETADTDGGFAAGDDVTIPDTTSVQEANREPDEASITAYSTSSMADTSFGRAGRAAAAGAGLMTVICLVQLSNLGNEERIASTEPSNKWTTGRAC